MTRFTEAAWVIPSFFMGYFPMRRTLERETPKWSQRLEPPVSWKDTFQPSRVENEAEEACHRPV